MEIQMMIIVIAIILIISALILISMIGSGGEQANSLFSKIACPWC